MSTGWVSAWRKEVKSPACTSWGLALHLHSHLHMGLEQLAPQAKLQLVLLQPDANASVGASTETTRRAQDVTCLRAVVASNSAFEREARCRT